MIKAIIVDDELGARESLSKMIEKNCKQLEVIAKADSMLAAFEAITNKQPDLVFLDIEMPNGNAFDLLEKFKEINFNIIFTTAYDHYAIKAIKFSAIDYILKPIDPEELVEAVKRVEKKQTNQPNVLDKQFKTLLSNVRPENKLKKVGIPDGDGLIFINLADIIRCESDGNYTFFILTNGKKIIASRTLGEYEQMFTEDNFFRIHRSHLVNLQHVKKYIKGEGGYVIMADDSQVEVSRRNKNEFLEKLSHV
ncbi:MAG TPA: LytTR family DNA-binding domain-containing protein [Bacteroidia bacterium]|nr:LytTR family DNA-binding domain-containing protein [Bacteroidia bacterium]HRG52675.1 LytTR family DNA-binding domain-containing protein [Bacteroidia bacterium]